MADWLSPQRGFSILKMQQGRLLPADDFVAVEEALEIRIAFGPSQRRTRHTLSVTMRTPGHDFDLVAGFLFCEGIIHKRSDILQMRYLGPDDGEDASPHILLADLRPGLTPNLDGQRRFGFSASACGACGKSSLEALRFEAPFPLPPESPRIDSTTLALIPAALQGRQPLFACTGGAHAAALFNPAGELLDTREDIGRHNALDKLIGAALAAQQLPLQEGICMVSGRAGYELVQKALMAGIPCMASVGAPSSLAVELARTHHMTLIGFFRETAWNVYSGEHRLNLV
jgi:FdhD protein